MKNKVTDRKLIANDEVDNLANNYVDQNGKRVNEAVIEKARRDSGHPRSRKKTFAALALAGTVMITRYMWKKLAGK